MMRLILVAALLCSEVTAFGAYRGPLMRRMRQRVCEGGQCRIVETMVPVEQAASASNCTCDNCQNCTCTEACGPGDCQCVSCGKSAAAASECSGSTSRSYRRVGPLRRMFQSFRSRRAGRGFFSRCCR